MVHLLVFRQVFYFGKSVSALFRKSALSGAASVGRTPTCGRATYRPAVTGLNRTEL
jgi:hypothetical protein